MEKISQQMNFSFIFKLPKGGSTIRLYEQLLQAQE